jgi:hypothetical protein
LHSCDEVDSTLDTIYRHFENEHLLSMNLSWEVALKCNHTNSWTSN